MNVVRIECPRSDRVGSYRRDGLLARFGADIALPDLLLTLAECERRRDFSKPVAHGSRTWRCAPRKEPPGCPPAGES
jgi:hypothetical protein